MSAKHEITPDALPAIVWRVKDEFDSDFGPFLTHREASEFADERISSLYVRVIREVH